MAEVAPSASAAVAFASGHYHFSVGGVGRGNGAPVMAKAAYRSGEALFDQRTGELHDYRGGELRVIDKWIMTQRGVEAPGREALWNAAEAAEPRKNGRLATEFEIGLPHELTDAQRKDMLKNFLAPIIESYGVAADVAIHTADDWRNVHAHILLTHREYGPDGFGEIANTRFVNRKRKGEVVREQVAGIAATPADIKFLREQWANAVNRAYEKAGFNIRVDHRSFIDRGIKELPTIHEGPKATAMERRGQHSDRGDINRIIKFGNAELRQLEADKQRQDAEIIDLKAKLAERLAQQQPRTDGAEKNYSKQGGAEIPAAKDNQPMPDDPRRPDELAELEKGKTPDLEEPAAANQNRRGAPEPVPAGPAFGPETIAATSREEIERLVAAIPEEQRTIFTAEPGLTAPEAVAAAKADNFRVLPPDEARETFELWAAATEAPQPEATNQNNAERIAVVASQETPQPVTEPDPYARYDHRPLIRQGEPAGEIGRDFRAAKEPLTQAAPEAVQTPEAEPAPTAQPEAKGPTDGPQRAAQAENSADPGEPAQAAQNREEARAFDAAVFSFVDAWIAAAHKAERVSSGFLASAAALVEGIISRLGDLWASPSRPTELEREVAPKVAAERAQENAELAAYFDNEAARDRLLDGIRIDDAEQERQARLEGGRGQSYEPE